MKHHITVIATLTCVVVTLSGCAGLRFGEGYDKAGLTFFDPVPHLLVKVTAECVVTSEVVTLPGRERFVRLKSGYGSSALSLTLANGMITTVGQTTDTKVPETISAVASLATAAAGFTPGLRDGGEAAKPKPCSPKASLFRIIDGQVGKDDLLDYEPGR